MRDPFEVLGVRRDAPMEEIDKAYKRPVAKYHPDRYRDNPLRELAEEKLKEINEAYETVKLIRSGYYTSDNKTVSVSLRRTDSLHTLNSRGIIIM